jgi:hypothetical protein
MTPYAAGLAGLVFVFLLLRLRAVSRRLDHLEAKSYARRAPVTGPRPPVDRRHVRVLDRAGR